MTTVTYTAQRSLTVGHSASVQYSFLIRARASDISKRVRKSEADALSGASETLLWHNKNAWQVVTAAVYGGELEQMIEFLESVIGGEQFTFDQYGSPNGPDAPVTVKIVGNYSRTRAVQQGDGGQNDYFRFSFVVREV